MLSEQQALKIIIKTIPKVIDANPINDFKLNFSCKNKTEIVIVNNIANLDIDVTATGLAPA